MGSGSLCQQFREQVSRIERSVFLWGQEEPLLKSLPWWDHEIVMTHGTELEPNFNWNFWPVQKSSPLLPRCFSCRHDACPAARRAQAEWAMLYGLFGHAKEQDWSAAAWEIPLKGKFQTPNLFRIECKNSKNSTVIPAAFEESITEPSAHDNSWLLKTEPVTQRREISMQLPNPFVVKYLIKR